MPAPEHLRIVLDALGTGGTVEMAEGVHRLISGLTAERDALAADAARLAEVLVYECEAIEQGETAYAAVARILRARAAEISRLNTLLEPKRATIREKIEASSLGTPDAVAARESVPTELAQAVVARTAELAGDDDGDHLVMSIAAFWLLSDAVGEPQEVECCVCGARYDLGDPDDTREAMRHGCSILQLVSSGTDDGAVDDGATDTIGDVMPASEAAAPVALDHDPRAETIALPEPEDDWDDEPADEPQPAPRPPTNDEIRDWCRTHGVAVSDRGPIGKTARRAYDEAHSGV